ncbi:MAG: hypothetical protein ACYDCJ_12525 [Gammaproteobacteria bacterium]
MGNVNLSDAAANAEANALAPLMNGGTIAVYSGTQPASANTALSGNTLLVTFTFGNPAFGAAAAGVLTANAIASGTAVATGTATFARILESGGAVVMDTTVGATGAGINLSTATIIAGTLIPCDSFSYTVVEIS